MGKALDLFPPAHPLIGKAVQIHAACRCGANIASVCAARGPHAAELRCRNCDRHVQWLAAADRQIIEKFFAGIGEQFGAPTDLIYRLPLRQMEDKMANGEFDNTDRGALFKNSDQREGKQDPDYRGTLNVGGTEFWINAWLKTSKKGVPYLSLSVKPKDAPKNATAKSAADDMNDLIPF
jgi:hypothetical protein